MGRKPPTKKAAFKRAEPKKAMPEKAAAKKTGAKNATPKKVPPKRAALQQLVLQAAANSQAAVLDRLHTVVLERRTADPARSHSARLLSRGLAKVAQKFGEEAVECLIEGAAGNADALVAESADVLYHLVVMWVAAGVVPDQVWAELARREGVSGVVEKAARARPILGTTKIP